MIQLEETLKLSHWVYYKECCKEYNKYNFVVYLFTRSRKMSLKTMVRVKHSLQEFRDALKGICSTSDVPARGFSSPQASSNTHLHCDFVIWATGDCRTIKIHFHFLSLWIWTLKLEVTNAIFQPGLTCCY